jgi:protein-S-isoprenylcysteine O-methyltransferase Ste14
MTWLPSRVVELYGIESRSLPQKGAILLSELVLIGLAYHVLFGELLAGVRAFGAAPEPARNLALFAFDLVVVARFLLTLFVFLRRKIPLEETFSVPLAFALYLLGFPLMARGREVPFGALEFAGVGLFLAGSVLNTLSEWQRHRFKLRPESKGKLYSGGLFSLSIHVNYFGDLLWVLGYALVTHNGYALLVPVCLFCFFWFFNVPKLDAYLRERYGDQFSEYERRTKRLVPFVL